MCPSPEHPPPLQPVNAEPAFATAVRVTICPDAKLAWHVGWHVIPDGLLETLPMPLPASPIESVGPLPLNAAVTLWLWLIVRLHVPVPEQSPLQPVNEEPACGVAVRVTLALAA